MGKMKEKITEFEANMLASLEADLEYASHNIACATISKIKASIKEVEDNFTTKDSYIGCLNNILVILKSAKKIMPNPDEIISGIEASLSADAEAVVEDEKSRVDTFKLMFCLVDKGLNFGYYYLQLPEKPHRIFKDVKHDNHVSRRQAEEEAYNKLVDLGYSLSSMDVVWDN